MQTPVHEAFIEELRSLYFSALAEADLRAPAATDVSVELLPMSISLSCTPRTLENHLSGLEADGVIVWHRRPRGGRMVPHTRLSISDPSALFGLEVQS